MIGFHRRVKFLQYKPSKHTKYGIMAFTCAEGESGYMLDFKMYEGKQAKVIKLTEVLVKSFMMRMKIIFFTVTAIILLQIYVVDFIIKEFLYLEWLKVIGLD